MHEATQPVQAADTTSSDGLHFFVLGATGRTGSLFVSRCLERGHSVTAFVRNPTGFPAAIRTHQALTIHCGELSDVGAISTSLLSARHDILVSMLASEKPPFTAVSTGTRSLLRAVESIGEVRTVPFFSIASWGMGPSQAHVSGFLMRTLVSIARSTFWSRPYADFERQFIDLEIAEGKGLVRPTILLPAMLTQGQKSDTYAWGAPDAIKHRMRVTSYISRASLADLCLRLAERAADEPPSRWIAIAEAPRH